MCLYMRLCVFVCLSLGGVSVRVCVCRDMQLVSTHLFHTGNLIQIPLNWSNTHTQMGTSNQLKSKGPVQECLCCTMTSLCRDMACLSHVLWQSHTCSTYAKGLTKPEIHQSAFKAHRHTKMRCMHTHAETHTELMWHCLCLHQGGSLTTLMSWNMI